MEKPAVIFSEQGFKMFLDFVKGMQESKTESSVDTLVKDYFARPDRPHLEGKVEEAPADTKYDMDAVAIAVSGTLMERPGRIYTSEQILDALRESGFNYQLRSIAPVMKGVMNRDAGIQRIAPGEYMWVGEPDEA